MSRILESLGLESRPRWLAKSKVGNKITYVCSVCDEHIYSKTEPPKVCPNCQNKMKEEIVDLTD